MTPEEVGLEKGAGRRRGRRHPGQNAAVLRGVLSGDSGTERSLALLNAGAAIYVGGAADSIEAGVRRAEESIDSGAAREADGALRGAQPGADVSARLESLVASTREALERRKRERPLSELEGETDPGAEGRPFAEALARPGTSLIAEHKRRSPSAGTIREGAACADLVRAYERGGAAAASVLTEEAHFGGSLADLREARGVTDLPLLRKDFTVDPYQLYEAKSARADAVLLVVVVDRRDLSVLHGLAGDLDLDALVEVSPPRSWRPRSRSTPT